MKPAAATTPEVAPTHIRKVMTAIWLKFDRLVSPEYACQLVLVIKDTVVLNAVSGVCAASPSGLIGITACRRRTR